MAVAFIAASAMLAPSTVSADHGTDAAKQAAADIQDARDRANAASQAMFDAEADIDAFDIEITNAQERLTVLEGEASEMREGLEAQAVNNYVGAGAGDFPLLIDFDEINDGLTADVMSAVSRETAFVDVDEYDALMDDVNEARDELEQDRTDSEDAKEEFADLMQTAEDEVEALATIEAERLVSEEVEHELERQRQEREAEEAAIAAQEAAELAAATPAPDPSAPATPTSDDESPQEQTAPMAPASEPDSAPPPSASPQPEPEAAPAPPPEPEPTPAPPPEPAPAPPPEPEPAPAPAPPPPSNTGGGMVCPVNGPRAFADTWGAARSGGRSHEGVDMMSPSGTPLVAVESGSVQFKTNRLGGNAVWLTGSSGTKYYYAHLSAWEGSSRAVSQGETIGYVGRTGNTQTNHLHFEVLPGGGRAVNPYPYVRAVC